jgi:hypothetical protein
VSFRFFFVANIYQLFLKKSDRIAEPDAAPDFRREFFDERQMIAVKFVGQIVSVERENMREMLRPIVYEPATLKIRNRRSASRAGKLCPDDRRKSLRDDAQTFIAKIQTDARARRRNARQIQIFVGQLRAHRVGADKRAEIFMQRHVRRKFRAEIARVPARNARPANRLQCRLRRRRFRPDKREKRNL